MDPQAFVTQVCRALPERVRSIVLLGGGRWLPLCAQAT